MLSDLLQDVRYGVRALRKTPAFTLVAVVTLALCIGANTAMFSVVDAVLLRPLPIPEADRLLTFWITAPAKHLNEVDLTPGLFAHLRDRSHSFTGMSAYQTGMVKLSGSGDPEVLDAAQVSPGYFNVLGRHPRKGRAFVPEEERPGQPATVILSHELWQRRFQGDPGILGRSIVLDDVPTVVVGVMPPRFEFPNRAEGAGFPPHVDLWLPLPLDVANVGYWNFLAVGRLAPGIDAARAQRELNTLWLEFARAHDAELGAGALGPGASMVVRSLKDRIVGEVRTPMWVLLCAFGLVLLVACANLASLMLIRAAARRGEIAIRCCLGASPQRIVRHQLAESAVLAAAGGAAGLLLAFAAVRALAGLTAIPAPRLEPIGIHGSALVFTLALMMLAVLVLGLAPALGATRFSLINSLKQGVRGSARASSRRLSGAFVIAQITMSVVLLSGAGLLIQSFRNLVAVDPGFRAENVWSGRVALPSETYPTEARVRGFYADLLERTRHIPGVLATGLCQVVPFSGGGEGYAFTVEGYVPAPGEPARDMWRRSVSADYFGTMGIPILRGRAFDATDSEDAPRVAIVDDKLARAYWPHEDPIGQRLKIGGAASDEPWLTVVGVAASVKNRRLDEDAKFYVYQPCSQWVRWESSLVLRMSGNRTDITSAVRRELAALDPQLPLYSVTTVAADVRRSLDARRVTNTVLFGLAMSALLLAVIGIYGVMAISVGTRTNEFGIRLALGSPPGAVLTLVMGQGMRLALLGIGLGLVGTVALTGFLKSLLYGVRPVDPVVMSGVVAVLAAAALAACYFPARRATRVDPIVALREE